MYKSFTGGNNDYYRGVNAELKRNNPDFNTIYEMGVKKGMQIADTEKKHETLLLEY